MLNMKCLLISLSLCLLMPFFVFAQEQETERELPVIPYISEPIKLDGFVNEAAWKQAKKVQMVQQQPVFGGAPNEASEVYMGYSDTDFYVACKCYDRNPVASASFRRDYSSGDSDWFEILIDTFNDNENMLLFATTPTGLRTDFSVSNDGEGSNAMDIGWNTRWEVESRITGEGYFVEMRIPLSSLRFQEKNGEVVMGVSFFRAYARNAGVDIYPAIPPTWRHGHLKASLAQDFVLKKVENRKPFTITPYGLTGISQQNTLNADNSSYKMDNDPVLEAGLDLKYGLTSNLTMDLTVNTDFAQVEADNQQINLTRFPLFFPEKRNFFLERASNFSFDFGGINQLFYSRRIGIQNGNRIPILGGTRLVGRVQNWDVGFLTMQTARETLNDGSLSPSENFGVLRLRKRVINPYSYVGGITTSRLGADGSYNLTYGLDGIFQLFGSSYLSAKWAQTFDDSIDQKDLLSPARIQLQFNKRSNEGFLYDFQYDYSGETYTPGIGFQLRQNYSGFENSLGYGWFPGSGSPIQSHKLNVEGAVYYRNTDHSIESLVAGPEYTLKTNSGHTLRLQAEHQIEDLLQPLQLSSDIGIPLGRYAFNTASASYIMPYGWPIRSSVTFKTGGFFDGYQNTFRVSPSWNASRFVSVGASYEFNHIKFEDIQSSVFESHIARLKLELTPNVKMSLLSFVQYNSVANNIAANIRLRYNWREGNDLYLVLNENLNTDRHRLVPNLPVQQSQTILLKYTYTFNMDR